MIKKKWSVVYLLTLLIGILNFSISIKLSNFVTLLDFTNMDFDIMLSNNLIVITSGVLLFLIIFKRS